MNHLQVSIIAVAWLFFVLAAAAVTMRMFSRLVLSKNGGWDDMIIALSLAIYLTLTVCLTITVTKGACRHLNDIPLPDLIPVLKWLVITDGIGLPSFTIPKLSVAILLVRISSLNDRAFTTKGVALCTPAILLILWSFAALGLWFGQCTPTSAVWDKITPGGRCLDQSIFANFSTALGACSAATDFFYATYPIYIISRLQTTLQRKIHLGIILGLGAISGAFAVWKTVASRETTEAHADLTYSASSLFIANQVETGLLIVTACIPTIGPAVRSGAGTVRRAYYNRSRGTNLDPTVAGPHSSSGSNAARGGYIAMTKPGRSDAKMPSSDSRSSFC